MRFQYAFALENSTACARLCAIHDWKVLNS